MSEKSFTGTCLCRGITFELAGEPESVFWCYCSHCTKNAGGPGQISAKFKKEQVTMVKGADLARTYVISDTTSGVEKHKLFCKACGCTLWTIPMKHGGEKLMVRTALVKDGLITLQPKAEFFAPLKPTFFGDMKQYETMPGH